MVSNALLLAFLGFIAFSPQVEGAEAIKEKAPNFKEKINLIGGASFTFRVQPNIDASGKKTPITPNDVSQAIQIIEKRLNQNGISDLYIVSQGTDRILIELPGITPKKAENICKLLLKKTKLELKLVHPDTKKLAKKIAEDPKSKLTDPAYELKVLIDKDSDGTITKENILVKRRAALDGTYIVHAQELYGPDEGKLTVELNDEGAKKMFHLTQGMNLGHDRLAIVLDGKVLSAPTVQQALSKRFEISGLGTAKEAKELASALLNPLKNPLILVEKHIISRPPNKKTNEKEKSSIEPLAK